MRLGQARHAKGFTLVELLVTVAISGIVIIGVWSLYRAQTLTATSQEQVTKMQQNLRAALIQMKTDIRMAGFDFVDTNQFGITGVEFRDLDGNADPNGIYSSITFTSDDDQDGILDDPGDFISYQIFDSSTDNMPDLARRSGGGGRQLLAENIELMGMAFAYDNDGDNALDTYMVGLDEVVIWAVDSDNNGTLDRRLDGNGDGFIDVNDTAGGAVNTNIGGAVINPTVPLSSIRAVRVWLLARARHPDENYFDNNTYVVGRYVYQPQDRIRRRLAETVIECRNMGL